MARDMTLWDAMEKFKDEKEAGQFFIEARWPTGIACPKCGSLDVYEPVNRKKSQRFRCRDCFPYLCAKTDTPMHKSQLSFSKWALAMYLVMVGNKGFSCCKLAELVGVTQRTVWFMAHRVRKMWETDDMSFVGPVEVDEALIGGSESNRLARKKLKSGNFAAKTVVVGIKDRLWILGPALDSLLSI